MTPEERQEIRARAEDYQTPGVGLSYEGIHRVLVAVLPLLDDNARLEAAKAELEAQRMGNIKATALWAMRLSEAVEERDRLRDEKAELEAERDYWQRMATKQYEGRRNRWAEALATGGLSLVLRPRRKVQP